MQFKQLLKMQIQSSRAMIDAADCAIAGQYDTARELLDEARSLMNEPSGQEMHLMQFIANAHMGDCH